MKRYLEGEYGMQLDETLVGKIGQLVCGDCCQEEALQLCPECAARGLVIGLPLLQAALKPDIPFYRNDESCSPVCLTAQCVKLFSGVHHGSVRQTVLP